MKSICVLCIHMCINIYIYTDTVITIDELGQLTNLKWWIILGGWGYLKCAWIYAYVSFAIVGLTWRHVRVIRVIALPVGCCWRSAGHIIHIIRVPTSITIRISLKNLWHLWHVNDHSEVGWQAGPPEPPSGRNHPTCPTIPLEENDQVTPNKARMIFA